MEPPCPDRQRVALAILLLLAFAASAWVVAPLHLGLVLGTVVAFSTQPLFERLVRLLRGRRRLAAALTAGVGETVVLGGCAATLAILLTQLVAMVSAAQRQLTGATVQSLLGTRVSGWLDDLHVDPASLMGRLKENLDSLAGQSAAAAGALVSATAGVVLTAVIALFTMYYVTLEWSRLAIRIERVLPLDPRHTHALVDEFRDVARSAFVGTLATAVVQGVLAGAGFAIVGFPRALACGALTMMASLVPVFGTTIVWLPVAGFLLWQGRGVAAAFVVAWSLLLVMGLSDYVIRPRLVGRRHEGHPLLILLGVLGGIEVFGVAGLIVGPVVISLFVAIWRIYEREGSRGPRPDAPLP
jgi:predicted PurR-regulated permease PerM